MPLGENATSEALDVARLERPATPPGEAEEVPETWPSGV